MQFCFVYDAGVAEQRLVALFLRIYADAGVKSLPVTAGTPAAKRCLQFKQMTTQADEENVWPFVIKRDSETDIRHMLSKSEGSQWLQELITHAQQTIPLGRLRAFVEGCLYETFGAGTAASSVLQCLHRDVPPTGATEDATMEEMAHAGDQVSMAPPTTRMTKNRRVSVSEAMQQGRERETHMAPRQTTTR